MKNKTNHFKSKALILLPSCHFIAHLMSISTPGAGLGEMPRVAAVGTAAKAALVAVSDGAGTKPQPSPSAAVPDQRHSLSFYRARVGDVCVPRGSRTDAAPGHAPQH